MAIKRKIQVVTQLFYGYYNEEKKKWVGHNGVDLRCVDFLNWKLQKCVAPENVVIVRNSFENGRDSYGNHYVVYRGLDTRILMKSIHVVPGGSIKNKIIVEKGEIIGTPEIGGNSDALHEHFITMKKDDSHSYINPLDYFKKIGIEYKLKKGVVK